MGGKKITFGDIVITIVILFILGIALMNIFEPDSYEPTYIDGILQSTTKREPLKSSDRLLVDFDDKAWAFESNKDREIVLDSMNTFRRLTGVYPYLITLEEKQLKDYLKVPSSEQVDSRMIAEYAAKMYDKLFKDGDHILVVAYLNQYGSYKVDYQVGENAKSVIDGEALRIIDSCVETYTPIANSDAELFSNVFMTSARVMMDEPTGMKLHSFGKKIVDFIKGGAIVVGSIFGIIIIIIVVIVTILVVKELKKRKKEALEKQLNDEMKHLDSIINEKQKDEAEILEEKYTNKN